MIFIFRSPIMKEKSCQAEMREYHEKSGNRYRNNDDQCSRARGRLLYHERNLQKTTAFSRRRCPESAYRTHSSFLTPRFARWICFFARYPDIERIGVTGQMHGILYLDGEGNAVSPLYTWQDARGDAPCEKKHRRTVVDCISEQRDRSLCCNRLWSRYPCL